MMQFIRQLKLRHSIRVFSSSSYGSVQAYGDQRTHYKQYLKQNNKRGGDRSFNIRRFEPAQDASIAGFGRSAVSGFSGRGGGSRGIGNPGSKLRPLDFMQMNLSKIQKNLYHEHDSVTRRSQAEIDHFISENEVTLHGENIPRPIFEFSESTFPEPILNLLSSSYTRPTAIQSISWPVALSGRDVISIGSTGSGKTLGFILPGIVHTTMQQPKKTGDGPTVLVLLPTRELAQQVEEVARDYCRVMNLSLTCCFGGASKGPQGNDLRRGVDICIATPGRLLDFLEAGTTNMLHCSYLVLDEADRMLDMGFEPQIRKIVAQIRPDRQTLMFSATWPKEVRTLAADFQDSPVFLNVGSLELSANHNIQQHVEIIDESDKQNRLFQLLELIMKEPESKTLIFVETKRKADDLTRRMRRDGWPALCIHGDKSQSERDWVLNEFREGKTPVLLATDVAARGLGMTAAESLEMKDDFVGGGANKFEPEFLFEDVNDIKYVINYDYPNSSEDYVHRIGRTGRRDQKGTSYTFFTPTNAPKAGDLIKVLKEAKQNVPEGLVRYAQGGSGGRNERMSGGRYEKASRNGGYNKPWSRSGGSRW